MSQARKKGAGKAQHVLQLVHCWEVLWDPGSMSMSKRSPSVIEPLDDMWWCNKKQTCKNELDEYSMYVFIPFFLHKILASHRQPTFRDSRWTNYSNPGQLYPPRPRNFKVVFFFQGLRRVDKTNQTPQHDISRTRSLTLTFGEGGVVQSFPRGLNILSIYCMKYAEKPSPFAVIRMAKLPQTAMTKESWIMSDENCYVATKTDTTCHQINSDGNP